MIPPVEVSPLIKTNTIQKPDDGNEILPKRCYNFKSTTIMTRENTRTKLNAIHLCRYSALLLGIIYGARRYAYLKPIAAEDRRLEAEEKAKQEELKRIAKALEEAQESILK